MTKKRKRNRFRGDRPLHPPAPMEGYANVSGPGRDFDNLDIEGRYGGGVMAGMDQESAEMIHERNKDFQDQRRLLDIKVRLEGGGFGYVFTLRHVDHITRFNCHLCEVVIIGQTNVDEHILGKKHQVKMATPYHDRMLFPRVLIPPQPDPNGECQFMTATPSQNRMIYPLLRPSMGDCQMGPQRPPFAPMGDCQMGPQRPPFAPMGDCQMGPQRPPFSPMGDCQMGPQRPPFAPMGDCQMGPQRPPFAPMGDCQMGPQRPPFAPMGDYQMGPQGPPFAPMGDCQMMMPMAAPYQEMPRMPFIMPSQTPTPMGDSQVQMAPPYNKKRKLPRKQLPTPAPPEALVPAPAATPALAAIPAPATTPTPTPAPAPAVVSVVQVAQPVIPGFEEKLLLDRGVAQIQPTLDRFRSGPLVGLEYLVELTPRERDEEPMYVCVMCEKRGDPRVAMAHITSYNHRSRYLGINFPKASRAIAVALPRSKEGRQGNVEIVSKICSKIEEKHGRLIPLTMDAGDYEEKKDFYKLKLERDMHFRESSEETYEDVVESLTTTYSIKLEEVPLPEPAPAEPEKKAEPKRKIAVDRSRIRPHASKEDDKKDAKIDSKKDIKKDNKKDNKKDASTKIMESSSKRPSVSDKKRGKRGDSLSSISSVSSSTLSRSPSPSRSRSRSKSKTKSKSRSPMNSRLPYYNRSRNSRRRKPKQRSRSRSRSPVYRNRNRSRSRSDSKSRFRNPLSKPKSKPKKRVNLDPVAAEKEKWTNFREELDKVEQKLTKSLKFHEKNPEKHPMYPEEWKKFWNRRYKEIQARGQDPSTHDFKPEWIEFWNVRMKEMHQAELQKAKEELRKALNLPKDGEFSPGMRFARGPPPRPVEVDDDIIVISPTSHLGREFKPAPRKGRHRSPSPWDDEEIYSNKPSGRQYSRSKAGSYHDRSRGHNRPPAKPHYEEDDPVGASNEPIKVVTVLRLVTALESQLGSIGPTVNNLLASALAMEKARPGSSEVLLGNTQNLVLFDTVKEKLKGQLFAGIVEQGLLLATRSCIQNLAELLYRAENMPNAPTVQAKSAPIVAKPALAVASDVGAIDKVAIAQQIAAALVAQGKTDVTHEELEQLINAVVGMAQASASMDTPITTAAFASMQEKAAHAPAPPVVSPPVPSPPVPTPPTLQDRSPLERLLSVVHSKTTPPVNPKVSAPLFPCVESNIPEPPRAPSISSSPPKKQKLPSPEVKNVRRDPSPEVKKNKRDPTPEVKKMRYDSSPEVKKMSISYMEDLNESDLKELLQNFSHLSTPEQHCLIAYLKKLEATDPDRVEKLRKFVNLSPIPDKDYDEPEPVQKNIHKDLEPKEDSNTHWKSGRLSPFSMRMGGGGNNPVGGANPTHDESVRRDLDNEAKKIKLDDSEDDDDYSYEDIYAAASKKVNETEKEKQQEKLKAEAEEVAKNFDFDIQPFNKLLDEKPNSPALTKTSDPSAVLRETKLMIANLMGQFPLKFNLKKASPPSRNINPTTPKSMILPTTPTPTITTPTKPIITTPTEDLPKRSKIGTNIDISNNLTEAASRNAQAVSSINVVTDVRPVPTLVSAPSPGSIPPSYNPNYNPHYQPFHEEQQQLPPHDHFPEQPGPYPSGFPNQHYQQGYPGPEYNGFYPGPPQEPPQEYGLPVGRGFPPQQPGFPPQQPGFPQPRPPMQPPYGGAGPPQQHRYPNQFGGPGPGYNQYPPHPPQGYY